MNNYDVIIIGAGVSGVFCAINKDKKLKVLLIDGNKEILKKFMITGKGKSNITNTSNTELFLKNIIDGNKFLYPSLTRYNGKHILNFLDSINIKYYEKEPNRVHLTNTNEDFKKEIYKIIKQKEIDLELGSKVNEIIKDNNQYEVRLANKKVFYCTNLVIATGGMSFSKLGSDGFGYQIAKKFNHKISSAYPIGVGLHIDDIAIKSLQGISLSNVKAKVYWDEKLKYQEVGDIMFTHYGLGGPLIRRISGYVTKYLQTNNQCRIVIDYLDKNTIDNELKTHNSLNQCFKDVNKNVIRTLLGDLYDSKLDLKNITKSIHQSILGRLYNVNYLINSYEPIEQAINTGGGVSLNEINPNTLESTKSKGLYFIGEVLDINPRTNGYNITVCYSTALTCIKGISGKDNSK